MTAYAHADEILVKKCDVVKRGQTIATAGATGDASQPQLHFEIRKNAKPVDPTPLLGSVEVSARSRKMEADKVPPRRDFFCMGARI